MNATEIQEIIRERYDEYWNEAQALIQQSIDDKSITEEEAADIVIY